MKLQQSDCWSEGLIQLTKQAIHDGFVAPDGLLHMKCADGGFGSISLDNLVSNRLLVTMKSGHGEILYESVDDLLQAGWVVD